MSDIPDNCEIEESTEISTPVEEEIAEGTIEETLYGKNKPRRETIRVKIIHD